MVGGVSFPQRTEMGLWSPSASDLDRKSLGTSRFGREGRRAVTEIKAVCSSPTARAGRVQWNRWSRDSDTEDTEQEENGEMVLICSEGSRWMPGGWRGQICLCSEPLLITH